MDRFPLIIWNAMLFKTQFNFFLKLDVNIRKYQIRHKSLELVTNLLTFTNKVIYSNVIYKNHRVETPKNSVSSKFVR
ncbi:unknown [Prevotella sp. CAG:617]|nr:unknown [Prevotella sp. CAG:617]